MLDYAWFNGHVNTLSRQRLKTLVKSIAVTPHHRNGRWAFRDGVGRELALPDVFAALMDSSVGRSNLEREYSYPTLAEEQWRNRQAELRRSRLEKIVDACRFLTGELGYCEPFELPATLTHERLMWEMFRFERGHTVVELSHTDIRVPSEWSLRIDGKVVAQTIDDVLSALTRLQLREETR